VINDRTLPRLSCDIVAGAANNQLREPRHGTALHARGILYAPDYVTNAGGLINIGQELRPGGYDRARALAQVATIETTLAEIFERSEREDRPTHQIADQVAEERIAAARRANDVACRGLSVVAEQAAAG
jgi:leucine dehydrogenase